MAISDNLILGHKHRAWDHESKRLQVFNIAKEVTSTSKAYSRVVSNANTFLDGLTALDNASLRPVWDVINDQRDKYRAAANDAPE